MASKSIPHRNAIPILYTKGTHYDVGFHMGHTFSGMIQNFLQLSSALNKVLLPLYETPAGSQLYKETLETVKSIFPHYIRELEGIAEGAKVEFYKLFLLHMTDVMAKVDKDRKNNKMSAGCTTIVLNHNSTRLLAHVEDAFSETLNHFYYVVAHIINEEPQGKYNTMEERFMSLCCAGHLPGYTMSYNHHGIAFSINALRTEILENCKIPRHIITRALLGVSNFDQALHILKEEGASSGDGFSINLVCPNDELLYNIELAPTPHPLNKSHLDIKEVPIGMHNFHVNSYERIEIPQGVSGINESNTSRLQALSHYKPPKNRASVLEILGDGQVFLDDNTSDQPIKTISVGVLDLKAKNIAIYSNNPRSNEPDCTLPLTCHADYEKF